MKPLIRYAPEVPVRVRPAAGVVLPDPAAGKARGEGPLSRLFNLCNSEQMPEFLPEKRSFRLHGHSTTIRLERAFWSVLQEMASEEGITISALIAEISGHCLVVNDKNLASCLRVACLKYINICT